jgi:signal transduction histidine kinase
MVLPTMIAAGRLPESILSAGPFGIAWLRPQALFGTALDPVSHAALWSLGVNLALYLVVSALSRASFAEQRQAEAFVAGEASALPAAPLRGQTTFGDLVALATRYLGADAAANAFRRYAAAVPAFATSGMEGAMARRADQADLRFTERLLAGAIGAASARVVVAGSLAGTRLSRREAMAMLDEASHAIRFNRELLEATLQNVSQGICVFDAEMRIATWNRRFLELNELPPDRIRVGMSLAELVDFLVARGDYGRNGETLLDRRRANALSSVPDVYERERPDGTVLEIASTPMPDGGFVVTYTDVTERRRAAEALERRVAERTEALRAATAEAERANLGKTRFLAAASHDLLQPLHAARLFTSALAERRRDDLVEKLDASLKSVEALLGALLDVSKLDGGGIKPQVVDFPLEPLLRAIEAEFTPLAEASGVRLTVVPSSAAVRSDPALLRRVLQNFVANAIRYTAEGRVLAGARRRGGVLSLEVWDTGPGIPDDKREEIFEEFRRLAPVGEGAEKGLGLGLAIVRRIAGKLQHPVQVRSRVGRGSCFSVEVPLAATAPAAASEPAPGVGAAKAGFGGALVLCLDNERAVLDGMEALLGGWGCTVVAARTRAEALALLAGRRPRAIVADYHLDGDRAGTDELEGLFAAFGRSVPSVVVTADHTDAVRERIAGAGHAILYKPARPAALRAQLTRLLQSAPEGQLVG